MEKANADSHNIQQTSPEKPHYPMAWEALEKLRILYKKPTVEGRENLPAGPCVIATTHLSTFDVPEIAGEIMKGRKTGIAMQSSIYEHPLLRPFVKMMGKNNLFPISNRNSSTFGSKDLEPLKNTLARDGRTIVIAGHNPIRDWKLPDRPGLAAVILAHQAKAPLVPVTLNIELPFHPKFEHFITKKMFLKKRADSKIIIGNPISFSQIPDDKLDAVVNLYSSDKRRTMTEEQIKEAQGVLDILKSEAGEVMKSFAANLPPEKRGKWG